MINDLITLMRARKWFGNIVILLHFLFFSNSLDPKSSILLLPGFFILCFLSSGIYIINSLAGRKTDIYYSVNCERALIIAKYNICIFYTTAFCLIFVSIGIASAINISFGLICLFFIIWQLLYSFFLREIFIVDVLAIGIGYVLRTVAGASIVGMSIDITWVLFIFSLCCLILFCKRGQEAVLENGMIKYRKVLSRYNLNSLIPIIVISGFCAVIFYMFTSFKNIHSLFTLPFLIVGIYRYIYIVFKKGKGAVPEKDLFSDKLLVVNLLFYTASVVIIHLRVNAFFS